MVPLPHVHIALSPCLPSLFSNPLHLDGRSLHQADSTNSSSQRRAQPEGWHTVGGIDCLQWLRTAHAIMSGFLSKTLMILHSYILTASPQLCHFTHWSNPRQLSLLLKGHLPFKVQHKSYPFHASNWMDVFSLSMTLWWILIYNLLLS